MTDKRQWTLITALVCVAILALGFLLLVKPQHTKVNSIKTQTTGVQEQVASLHAQLAQLQEESKNLATQQAELARIAQQLPADPQLPTLLRTLDVSAKSTSVELVNVAPGNPVAFSLNPAVAAAATATGSPATTPTVAAATSTAGAVPGLADIPVSLTVSGGYFQLERFLDSLEGLKRSMLVTGFSLSYKGVTPAATSAAGPVPTVGDGEMSATINTEVFMSTAALGSSGTPTSTTAP